MTRECSRRSGKATLLPVFVAVNFLCLAGFTPAFAQAPSPFELAATYANSFAKGDYDIRHYQGWIGSVGFSITPTVEIVADVIGEYHSDRFSSIVSDSFSNYFVIGGPKFSPARGHIRPYFKILFGVSRTNFTSVEGPFRQSFVDTGLALEPGGGVDVILSQHFAWRLDGDWVLPGASLTGLMAGFAYPSVRVATGLTYRH
jgi:hypothetical protein